MIATNFAEQNDVLGCGGNKDCFDLPIARAHCPKSVQALGEEQRAWEIRCKHALDNNLSFTEPPIKNYYNMVFFFWALKKNDIAKIVKNGGIYLGSRGTTHPPIRPYATNPFAVITPEIKTAGINGLGKPDPSY